MTMNLKLFPLLFMCCTIITDCTLSKAAEINLQGGIGRVEEKKFDEVINGTVSSGDGVVTYEFAYNFTADQKWTSYVCIQIEDVNTKIPLLIAVRQSLSVLSLEVPLILSDSSTKHSKVCHTLCPLRNFFHAEIESKVEHIFVDVSTASKTPIEFELKVQNLTKFIILTNERMRFNITPSEPHVLEYHMPKELDSVLIESKSTEEKCMILAIQDIWCPFYDSERTVEYKGFYQTMTLQSGITVTRKAFEGGKVYIVMIVKPTDEECTEDHDDSHDSVKAVNSDLRVKEIEVIVTPSISDKDFYAAVFGAFGVYILLYIFSFIICCFLFVRKRKFTVNQAGTNAVSTSAPSIQNYGALSGTTQSLDSVVSSVESEIQSPGNAYVVETPHNALRRQSTVQVDETDFDKLPDAEVDKNIVYTKQIVYVSDLSRKNEKYLTERTKMYSWNLLTVAVFYGLPVVQLVYINQKIVNITGNQDLCYYNFLCSHQLWVFSDFNHVYSNIGYVMLGLLFLLLAWRREVMYIYSRNEIIEEGGRELLGIPHHFGLYYAMGIALVMEGILSASYHVCPNKANFQFDTAFMYVIATVCMLKLYQARHPDITAKSHHTWMILAVVLLIGVAGVLQGGTLFWIIFVLGHVTVTFLVSVTIYYLGRWNLDRWLLKRVYRNILVDYAAGSFRPLYLGRFIILSVAVVLNLSLDLYGLIKRPYNFGAFLLAVFIMNLLLYLVYYTLMKVRYKERIRWIPLMYIFLSFACWIAALHFFLMKNTSWKMTPALSRERNKHCIILNFFDDHDIWHFFSSCALFFSFMVLFTLDDDLENTPRSSIVVF